MISDYRNHIDSSICLIVFCPTSTSTCFIMSTELSFRKRKPRNLLHRGFTKSPFLNSMWSPLLTSIQITIWNVYIRRFDDLETPPKKNRKIMKTRNLWLWQDRPIHCGFYVNETSWVWVEWLFRFRFLVLILCTTSTRFILTFVTFRSTLDAPVD